MRQLEAWMEVEEALGALLDASFTMDRDGYPDVRPDCVPLTKWVQMVADVLFAYGKFTRERRQ